MIKRLTKKIIPLHRHELPRFLCIASMMLLLSYMLNVLRISKDALIISHLGTETISAMKVWIVLPCSIAFMLLYIKIEDKFTRSALFHNMNGLFITYFALFILIIYPNRDCLTIPISSNIIANFPVLKYFFLIVSNWHYSTFFVFSEMFVTVVLSISFWQISNHITSIEESKRFYPLLGIAAQLGLMTSGVLSKTFSSHSADWQLTLNKTIGSFIISGILLSMLLVLLGKIIGKDVLNKRSSSDLVINAKNNKAGIKDSLKYIISSKPILLITVLLLCYNFSLNISEGVWKKSVEIFFAHDANRIHYFISNVNFYRAFLTMVFALLGGYIIRSHTWKTSALIMPTIIAMVGGTFFLFLLFRNNPYILATGIPALTIAVYLGTFHNTITKSLKHGLFDSTKEMMYINLDDDLKVKGKAAAETVGIRLGKGAGSFIQQILLTCFTGLTLLDLTPFIAIMFITAIIYWIISIIRFDKTD